MTHHHEEEKINYKSLYYIIGLLSGLFAGVVIDYGFTLIPILGVVGLLFAGFFYKVFVEGRGNA